MSGAVLKGPRAGNRDQVVLWFVIAVAVLIACLAVVGVNWQWTGFRGNETLWDWMSVLVTPLAIASLPIRIVAPGHVLVRRWRLVWPALAVVAAIIPRNPRNPAGTDRLGKFLAVILASLHRRMSLHHRVWHISDI